jgi:hypothetical protein
VSATCCGKLARHLNRLSTAVEGPSDGMSGAPQSPISSCQHTRQRSRLSASEFVRFFMRTSQAQCRVGLILWRDHDLC